MKHSSSRQGIRAHRSVVAFAAFSFSLPVVVKRCRCASLEVLTVWKVAALAALGLLLFVVGPAYGIALEFEPPGTQLDDDAILDISVTGGRLTFNVMYNGGQTPTSGAATKPLTSIRYEVNYDNTELEFKADEIGGGFTGNRFEANQNTGFISIQHR